MDFWITFWTWLLICSATVFAVLAVAVTIGGALDIKKLFRSMDAKHAEKERGTDGDRG